MVFIEALDNPSSPFFTEIKPFLVAAGLANIGNTCFLNAVLQCFTHTVQLVQSLRSFDHEFPCNDGGFCVLCALREHIDLSLASSGQTIIPWKLVENLNYLSSSLQRYRQEDAHEFFQCMLDRLHSCCVDLKPQDEPSSLQDDSFINQIFGGRLRSQLRCCNCGHCSDTFEPLIDLSLEIEDTDSVLTALESFTQVEKIEDTETIFTCESCREEVSLEKQLKLDKVPEVVTLHLKRFKSNGYYIQKIWEFVGYPLELDLQPFVSSSNDDDNGKSKYELYAVLVHSGISSYSGHYFCFICSSPHSWYQLDDSEVTRVSEEDVLHQEAYILFYKRQGSPWFSSLMEAQQMLNDSDSLSTSPDSGIGDLVALAGMVDCSASHREFDEVTDAPSTQPSSSSSPRILPEENSDVNDQIPCDQLRSVGKESLKKSSDEDGIDQLEMAGEEGLKKSSHDNGMVSKAVLRLLRGSMPDSRISQIMGCMAPSLECIDGSLKRQKMSDA